MDKTRDKNSITSLMAKNKILTENREIANAFNSHLVSVGPGLAQKIEIKAGDDPIKDIPRASKLDFCLEKYL